jgi:hypothetical protein
VALNGPVTSPRVRQTGLKGGSREPGLAARDSEAGKALPLRVQRSAQVKVVRTLATLGLTVTVGRGSKGIETALKAVNAVAEVAGME